MSEILDLLYEDTKIKQANGFDCELELMAIDEIESLQARIAEQRWIPVSERLPEHGKCVALLFETDAIRLGFQSYGPKEAPKYYFQPWGGQQWQLQPIAWSDCIPPLPQPPTEQE